MASQDVNVPQGGQIKFMTNDTREVCRITPDGNIVIPDGVELTEATRAFYDAVNGLRAQQTRRHIDLKHHINGNGDIVKTTNGQVISRDEPTILFRGRDYLAVPLLIKYREMCIADGCNDFQLGQVDELIEKFAKFARENPGVMKQPGVTRGL